MGSFIPHQDVPAPCDNQLDEEDAWVVEKHHLQDWDPVSIAVGH